MSISGAPQPNPRGQPTTVLPVAQQGNLGGGDGGNGAGTGGWASWLQELAKLLFGPAVVVALGVYFLNDKFATIDEQIRNIRTVTDHLDTRLTNADAANIALTNLLSTKSIDLVQQISNINVTVSAMKPQLDQLSADMKSLTATLNSIDQRTTRTETIIQQAPWVRR
jgi:hypothetical protein